jgi:hypothetical protein
MPFDNDEDLYAAIYADLFDMIGEVSERSVEVVKQNVKDIVYDPYEDKVKIYDRQGEEGGFLGSWQYRYEKTTSNTISTKVYSDAESMILDNERSIHGSPTPFEKQKDVFLHAIKSADDRRPFLDRAIAEGTDYDWGTKDMDQAWWSKPRDYWSPSIKFLMRDGTISKVCKRFLKGLGISFKEEITYS